MAFLSVPQHWTPEQALAVWEFFDEITRLIRDRYELSIDELLGPDAQETPPQADLFDDQDIPFQTSRTLLLFGARRGNSRAFFYAAFPLSFTFQESTTGVGNVRNHALDSQR
jgi:hypothetical protein